MNSKQCVSTNMGLMCSHICTYVNFGGLMLALSSMYCTLSIPNLSLDQGLLT